MVRTRRESHQRNGITDPRSLQPSFATKSATNGLTHRHKRSVLFWLSDGSYAVKISRRKIVRQQITSERGRFGDSLGNDVGQ
jgi:hypothetical protein